MTIDTSEEIAYREAVRALDGQARMVDELRSRTGVLLAGASVVTSLLGAPALQGAADLDVMSGIALLAFVGLVACCVWIVLPRRESWRFSLSAVVLVEDWVEEPKCGDATQMKSFLATTLGRNFDQNQELLENLYRPFTLAACLLGVEVMAWAIKLA